MHGSLAAILNSKMTLSMGYQSLDSTHISAHTYSGLKSFFISFYATKIKDNASKWVTVCMSLKEREK